jgi:hypothetical protein
MPSTLLDLCNNVLLRTGYQSLSTIVGNNALNARKILAAAQMEGRTLARMDWKILLKRNVLTTASSAETYSLPTDFDRFIDNTHWALSRHNPMDGPVTTQRWQANKSGTVTIGVFERFQVRADANSNRIFLDPIPTSSEQFTFYYATNTWCRSHGGARQSQWKADNDCLLLDDLVYELGLESRWLRTNGRPFEMVALEYEREKRKAFARDGGLADLSMAPPSDDFVPLANVGETGFGA